jgi:2'-hydroxyisoflavone reductase
MAGPDADQPLQGVDGRDLAAFTVSQVEQRTVDTFHVTAPDPAPTFAQILDTIAEGVGSPLPEVRWIGARDELPLTAPPDGWPTMRAGLGHARSAGFTWRPMAETVRDTLDWVRAARAEGSYRPRPGVGVSAEQEAELLASADQG